MSHDTNTIDSRTHEGELNKLGFLDFPYSRIRVIRYPIRNVINFATRWRLRWQDDYRII